MVINSSGPLQVVVDIDLKELIPEFLELTAKDARDIQTALSQKDFELVRRCGHSLKGAGSGYGFDAISELGAKIELEAKTGNIPALSELANELADYLARVEIRYE